MLAGLFRTSFFLFFRVIAQTTRTCRSWSCLVMILMAGKRKLFKCGASRALKLRRLRNENDAATICWMAVWNAGSSRIIAPPIYFELSFAAQLNEAGAERTDEQKFALNGFFFRERKKNAQWKRFCERRGHFRYSTYSWLEMDKPGKEKNKFQHWKQVKWFPRKRRLKRDEFSASAINSY